MRTTLLTMLMLPALFLAAGPAACEESEAADATPAAAANAEEKDDEFVLPPGFKPRKRGKFIVYCRKETVMGTRFSRCRPLHPVYNRDWKATRTERRAQAGSPCMPAWTSRHTSARSSNACVAT